MGMLDVLKRWFGGGKPQPAKTVRPVHTAPAPRPVAPATPASVEPVASAPSQPIAPIVAEAHDDADARNAQASVERRHKPRVNARDGTRVLIIDDSPTIVALLKRMLEQNGYKTLDAGDADTGLCMALSEIPDLIFLDIVLPGMNGFEALRRLRRDPISKTIPVIMISGNELATEQFYAQRIGADDFMKKPFARSEVFVRIEKLLDADKVPRRHLAVVTAAPNAPASSATAPVATPAASVVEAAVAVPVAMAAPTAAAPVEPAPAIAAATTEPASAVAEVPAAVADATEPVAPPPIPEKIASEAPATETPSMEAAAAPSLAAVVATVAVEAVEAPAITTLQPAEAASAEIEEPAIAAEPSQAGPVDVTSSVDEAMPMQETSLAEPTVMPLASVTSIAPPTAPATTPEAVNAEVVSPITIASAAVTPPIVAAVNAVQPPAQQAASS